MYKWRESALMLNAHATVLPGGAKAYRVHGWGVDAAHYDNPVHKHSCVEICYVMEGVGTYMDNDVDYPLRAGTFFCSKPGVPHQIRSRTGLQLLHVAFELDEQQASQEETDAYLQLTEEAEVCIHDADTAATAALWRALLIPQQVEQALPASQLPVAAGLLLSSFYSLFVRAALPQPQPVRSSTHLLQQAKRYIRDNLDTDVSQAQVAGYLHLSPRHLSRLFAEGIGESYSGFVRRERISRAAYLLKHSDLSIQQIAIQSGFGSVHAFTRAFTREKQQPPGRFRGE
ncbi:AraC family transcriptional regulator [Paenibacillus daejeonensis]|uniref:AraC family transcriptional regulator n=1 Tax=Paenibacillus daejeonensis TaxID=135193 RepID=UPI0003645564|nr:AraC family transcriptional regulator [Paenibacillus daejeonensis]